MEFMEVLNARYLEIKFHVDDSYLGFLPMLTSPIHHLVFSTLGPCTSSLTSLFFRILVQNLQKTMVLPLLWYVIGFKTVIQKTFTAVPDTSPATHICCCYYCCCSQGCYYKPALGHCSTKSRPHSFYSPVDCLSTNPRNHLYYDTVGKEGFCS